ncbi:MAG: P22 phage major capsid protein family protein [Bdellovibrionales bacterium]
MANSILTSDIIVKESLRELKNQLVFTKSVNRQYDNQFAQSGAKVGDTINIRKPSRYTVTDGATLEIQDSKDQSIPLTLDQHKHVGLAFSNKDLTLSVDRFKERYIKPAITALANSVDYTGYQQMYKKVYSAVGVPSASALPSTLKGFTQAKAKMALLGAPVTDLTATVDPLVEASLVEGLKGLFQSSEQIKEQYEKGVMGMAAGSKFKMTQNVIKHTIGALGGTPLMNGATLAGATTLVTDGWTAAAATRLKAGDVISVADVYAVNPQTRQSTGELAQFVVAEDAASDGSGNLTITLDRAIYASGQYQNVDALPQDGAAITVFGHASSYANIVAPQNMVFHKDAFVLACADFELPNGMDMAARASDPDSGLSISFVRGFDIVNHRFISRLDILFGWKCVYPEFACRVVGQPA